MSESKILVIGSSNTDMVICTGHLPLPGETVIGGTFFMNPGGKGANQAVTVARLGGRVSFICKTGSDIFGHQANQLFNEEGIDTSYVFSDTKNPSGVALITVDTDAENCIVVAPGANAHLTPNDLKRSAEAVEAADIILLQLEIPMQTVEAAAAMAYRLGKKVVLNPAPASKLSAGLLETLYAITPNETEAEAISGIRITDERTAEKSRRWVCATSSSRSVPKVPWSSTVHTAKSSRHTRHRPSTRPPRAMCSTGRWSWPFPRDGHFPRPCVSPVKPRPYRSHA